MIRYDQDGHIIRITFDSPATSNRFTYRRMSDFIAALEQARTSSALVLVLQANGDDFTLGRDQKEQLPVSRAESLGLILRANALLRAFPGVSITLIQGRAHGFGVGLGLHSTIAIGASNAVLAFDEIKHGLPPLVVVTYLADYVGPKIAAELVVTGRDVAAPEALTLGLLNRVVAPDQLIPAGDALAQQLAAYPHSALRLINTFNAERVHTAPADQGQVAVDRLAGWIEAGRP